MPIVRGIRFGDSVSSEKAEQKAPEDGYTFYVVFLVLFSYSNTSIT